MIAPMEKFILVVLESDAAATPVQLRKLGIAHVDSLAGSGEAFASLERRLGDAHRAVSLLTSVPRAEVGAQGAPVLGGEAAIGRALAVDAEIASIQAEQGTIVSEMQRVKAWGDFDPSLVARLAEEDLRVRFFEGPAKKIKDIAPEVEFFRIAPAKGNARIVVLGDGEPSNAFLPFTPPRESYSSLAGRLKALDLKQASLRAELAALAQGLPAIRKALERIDADLTIERLRSGMPCEENLRYLTGYVPSKEAPKLAAEAKRRGWALAMGEPGDEDQPPTKIENPKAIAIVQPVLDFLGTVPNYREYEISGWFLLFFTIFFAMIFGDGGYGLVLLLGATALAAKARKAGKPVAPLQLPPLRAGRGDHALRLHDRDLVRASLRGPAAHPAEPVAHRAQRLQSRLGHEHEDTLLHHRRPAAGHRAYQERQARFPAAQGPRPSRLALPRRRHVQRRAQPGRRCLPLPR